MKNTIIWFAVFAIVLIAGFIFFSNMLGNNTEDIATTYTGETITYVENDTEFTVRFDETGEQAQLDFNGETYDLKTAVSASGARYTNTDESVVFWSHQGEGTIEIDGKLVVTEAVPKGMDNPMFQENTNSGEMVDDVEMGIGQRDPAANKYDFIGMTETEAETKAAEDGVLFRVVERDGEMLSTTRDYRPGRINAVVESGVITSYTEEGTNQGGMQAREHSEIIGMTTSEAEAYAATKEVDFRVGTIDGEAMPVTLDFRPGRITAEIMDGVVVDYTVEAE